MNEFWFVPKTYGYGAAPVTWEGWLVVAVFIGITVAVAVIYMRRKKAGLSNKAPWAVLIASIVALVWICAVKTNGNWAWRWGQSAQQMEIIASV